MKVKNECCYKMHCVIAQVNTAYFDIETWHSNNRNFKCSFTNKSIAEETISIPPVKAVFTQSYTRRLLVWLTGKPKPKGIVNGCPVEECERSLAGVVASVDPQVLEIALTCRPDLIHNVHCRHKLKNCTIF